MRKWFNYLVVLAVCTFSVYVYAEFVDGRVSIVQTVKEARMLKEGQKAVLEGFIVRKVSMERYQFEDETGEIDLEVEGDVFVGRTITPDTKVRIFGEIDDDWPFPTLEVEFMDIIQLPM